MRKISLTAIVGLLKSRGFLVVLLSLFLAVGFFSWTDWGRKTKKTMREKVEKKVKPRFGEISSPALPELLPEEEAPRLSFWGVSRAAWKKFPKKMAVYKIVFPSKESDPGSFWARRLGLAGEGKEDGEGKRLWTKKGKIFRFRYQPNSFEYIFYPTESFKDKEKLTLAALSRKAEKVVLALGLFKEKGDFSLSGVKFLKRAGVVRGPVSAFAQADEAVFFFSPNLAGFPWVARRGGGIYPTEAHFDPYGRLIELRHHLLDFALGEEKTYPLKSWEESLAALGRGEGKIVDYEGGGLDMPDFKRITLEKVSLAYLFPQSGEEFLQPVFVFKGRKVSARERILVTLFLPAVSAGWLR